MTELDNTLESYFENSCIGWNYKENEKFKHYFVNYLSSQSIEEILKIFNKHSVPFLLTSENGKLKIFYEKL